MDIQTQKNILDVFRSLIEMSQRRGCWHAHELEHVGMTYNQVSGILEALNNSDPQQAEQEQQVDQQEPAKTEPKKKKNKKSSTQNNPSTQNNQ